MGAARVNGSEDGLPARGAAPVSVPCRPRCRHLAQFAGTWVPSGCPGPAVGQRVNVAQCGGCSRLVGAGTQPPVPHCPCPVPQHCSGSADVSGTPGRARLSAHPGAADGRV